VNYSPPNGRRHYHVHARARGDVTKALAFTVVFYGVSPFLL